MITDAGQDFIDSRLLATLYANGATLQELAERAGVSTPTIRKRLRAAGVTLRPRGGRHGAPDHRPHVARRLAEGASVSEIAAELGISRQRVYALRDGA